MLPGVTFLSSRVKEPKQGDWKKLVRILGFLKKTKDDVLTLEADDRQSFYWMIDASFGVHPDMKRHTGGIFTLGKGAIIADSTKQKANSRSSMSHTGLVVVTCPLMSLKTLKTNKTPLLTGTGLIALALAKRKASELSC